MEITFEAWSSLVEGDEGLNLSNCQSNLVITLHAMSLLLCNFTNTIYLFADSSLHLHVSCSAPCLKQCLRFAG